MLLGAVAVLVMQTAPATQNLPVSDKIRVPYPRGRPQSWITDDDYPAGSLRRREYGAVGFRLDVDAKGNVTDCHVSRSSGYSELDVRACEMLRKRAVFRPAQDEAGAEIPSVYKGTFTWVLPGGPRDANPVNRAAGTPVDSVVSLKALPKSYANPALLRLVFAGDTVKSCIVEASSGNAKLDAVACEQARGQVPPLSVEKSGWPVPDSRMATVTFEVAK